MKRREAMKDLTLELFGQLTLLILAIAAFVLSAQIDMEFASDLEIIGGPRRYPRIILAVFILMNVILIVSTVLKTGSKSELAKPASVNASTLDGKVRAAAVFLLLIVFVIAFEFVGYLILTGPLLIFVAMMNGARLSVRMVAVCVILTVTCLFVFRYGLNIVLPEGLLGIDGIF